ncbi:MAG: SUMF1/EgtB/PvdO family nonheme iron enzyme, partial [Bacteroidota bacterium]|nr:SUMF1/EgtB/PvdO family nonheme iron enzyme [Bacteroidota bacterium]
WYNTDYYKELADKNEVAQNPKGASKAFNSSNPYAEEKVIKGGSFLCSASYCASYRISSRMATSPDSGMEHLGFRTVWVKPIPK